MSPADELATWSTFATLAGSAAAALLGLLFFGLSLHVRVVADRRNTDARALAFGAFGSYLTVLVVALVLVVPGQPRSVLGLELLGLAVARAAQSVALVRGVRDGRGGPLRLDLALLRRRLARPAIAYVVLAVGAVLVIAGNPSALEVVAVALVVQLVEASLASLDFLVELGRTDAA